MAADGEMRGEIGHATKKRLKIAKLAVTHAACPSGIAATSTEMNETLLAEATMAMADVGDERAFLVTSMKFPAGGQRVEQIQQIVDCMHAADLHVDNGNVVFGPDPSDSRDNSCAVKMVAIIGD